MAEEEISKSQSQRKRRHERDPCINNLKVNLQADHIRYQSAWKPEKDSVENEYGLGSLDNVSRVPWHEDARVRRTRSLAISRENLFYSLDYTEGAENRNKRRSQLIPRAKLIEKSFIKDSRYDLIQAKLEKQGPRRISNKPPQEIPPDYSPLPKSPKNIDDIPPALNSQENSKPEVENRESLEEDIVGLSLPNYYPDSELTDNQSTFSQDKSKYVSLDTLPWNIIEQPESISYDENIVLAKKSKRPNARPKTVRGPIPYQSFDYEKLPQFSPDKASNPETPSEQHSSIEFETNTNFDEIRLNNENIQKQEPIRTLIEVCGEEQTEDFKSIVSVNEEPQIVHLTEEGTKSHSHKYLKEFLETQKGSKKPLQSFLAKKFSNLTRRNSKSNLACNQFYSLPDITVSKNLNKCEKIDRKLRKCDKSSKPPGGAAESRFIINIGKHFDINAKTNLPVDFQVKIAKVPKKHSKEREREFTEAVRNINNTLQSNGFCLDFNNNKMDPEAQEKVDNMRSYWTKMANHNDNEKCDQEKEPNSPTCKIIEVQTKVDNVKKKFEPPSEHMEHKPPNKVQITKQIFEPKPEKQERMSPSIKETCNFFEKAPFESLCPSSVELVPQIPPKKVLAKANSINVPEFDHVRYKVIKPEFFNKKILANCQSEAQFEGLMQYLQDYSFQELLRDNNIVIIEPIRSKIMYQKPEGKSNGTSTLPKSNKEGEVDDVKQGIRKHFFYHPIRVNKEVNDDELPKPELVQQTRQFFEKGSKIAEKEQLRAGSADPDKDKCSTSGSPCSLTDNEVEEDMYDSLDYNDCCNEYVSEDILERIREYGSTVTYYGGKVLKEHNGQPVLTKFIMEEIKDNEKRCMECSGCKRGDYQDFKFKLVKSNSCSSRLELVGAAKNKKNITTINIEENNNCIKDKNAINENIKMNGGDTFVNSPKIIGEERKDNKYVQWKEIKNNAMKINNYDFLEKVRPSKRPCDMEFEPYEVA